MYKLFKSIANVEMIIRVADNAFIPMDEQNSDYQAYLLWISEGNVPLEAVASLPADEAVP